MLQGNPGEAAIMMSSRMKCVCKSTFIKLVHMHLQQSHEPCDTTTIWSSAAISIVQAKPSVWKVSDMGCSTATSPMRNDDQLTHACTNHFDRHAGVSNNSKFAFRWNLHMDETGPVWPFYLLAVLNQSHNADCHSWAFIHIIDKWHPKSKERKRFTMSTQKGIV